MPRVSRPELIHKAATQSGSDMAKPPGLRRRGGSWEIRVRVPSRLRAEIGKREIIKSLGGVSAREAHRLGWLERAAIEQRFAQAGGHLDETNDAPTSGAPNRSSLPEAELIGLARRYLHGLESTAQPVPLDENEQAQMREALADEANCLGRQDAAEDATLQREAERFADQIGLVSIGNDDRMRFLEAVRSAWIEHLNRQLQRLTGATVATCNAAFAGVDAHHGGDDLGPTLSAAIDLYMSAPERAANVGSTRKMDRSRLGAMRDILGGRRPIGSITTADMREYAERLMLLPAHYTQRFPGMSPSEAIEAAKSEGVPTLSPTSIKRNLQAVKSFFGWLERQELIGKNPARNLEGPRTPKKSGRRPFETSEMIALLKATPRNGPKTWAYWGTRIAMLQGFRFTEPLGLQIKDLIKRGDTWVFRLQPNEYRSLKNEFTAREVPVHPRLIELGILDLLADRDPEALLIPDIPRSIGKSFNGAQKQMGRIIREHVSSDPNLTFHSLRHSFRDAMRDGGFPQGVDEHLGGWKVNSNTVMNGYGRGFRLEILREWIGKIAFDGVDIE